MNLHLQVLTGRQQGSRLQTRVQAGHNFLVPILARCGPFLGSDLQLTSGRDWKTQGWEPLQRKGVSPRLDYLLGSMGGCGATDVSWHHRYCGVPLTSAENLVGWEEVAVVTLGVQ